MQSFNPKYRGEDYLDMYQRLDRWYKKVKLVENNYMHLNSISIEEQEDCFYIFFLLVINTKDWLKKAGHTDIENLFYGKMSIDCLQICHDFVNNFKHFDNSRNPKIDKDTYFSSRSAQVRLGLSYEELLESSPIHTWYIKSKSIEHNAYVLADECYLAIKKFFENKKLI